MSSRFVIAFVVFGGLLRLWPLAHGLPDVVHPDEGMLIRRALAFSTGDLNPHSFHWPAFHLYVVFLFEGVLVLGGVAMGFFESIEAARRAYFTDPTPFHIAARLPSVLMGTATIGVTAAIAWEIGGRRAAGIAAALMSVAPIAVRDAHLAIVDVPAAFWSTIAIWVAIRAFRGAASWTLAGALAGLAAATKYNAGASIIAPLIGGATLPGGERLRTLVLVGTASIIAFAVATPYNLIDADTFLRDLRFQRLHLAEGHHGIAVSPVVYYAEKLTYVQIVNTAVRFLDPLPFLLLVGLVAALPDLRRWPARLVLLPPLAALVAMLTWGMAATRYWNPLLPPIAALAACGLAPLRRSVRAPLLASLVVTAGICVASDVSMSLPDTRTAALDWMRQHVPQGATVAVDRYVLRLPESRDALLARAEEPGPHPTQTTERMSQVYRWRAEAAPARGWKTILLGVTEAAEARNRIAYSNFDFDRLTSRGVTTLAVSSWGWHRVAGAADDAERELLAAFRRDLQTRGHLVEEIRPTGLQPGPTIWIYTLEEAR